MPRPDDENDQGRVDARAARFRTFVQLNRLILPSIDVEDILGTIAKAAAEIMKAPCVSVWTADPSTGTFDLRATTDRLLLDDAGSCRIPVGPDPLGWMAKYRQPLDIRDISADQRLLDPERWRRHGFRSFLAVPVLLGGPMVGVLAFLGPAPFEIEDDTLDLLEGLADRVALAIRNGRLYDQARRGRAAAQSLADVSRVLSETLDPEVTGRQIAASACALLGPRSCAVYGLEPDSGQLTIVASAATSADAFEWAPALAPGTGSAGLAVSERRTVALPDALDAAQVSYPPWLRDRLGASACRSLLAVPLLVRDRAIGAFVVADRVGRVFDADEVRLAQAFSDQAAIAFENARLHADAERRRRQAEVVGDVARALNASPDLGPFLLRVAEAARDICGSDIAQIALREADREAMAFRCRVGSRREGPNPIVIEPGRGLGGRAWAIGRPLRTANRPEDSSIGPDYLELVGAEGIVSSLVVPIRIGERVEGLIYVDNRSPRAFTDRDERVLLQLAEHAGLAIQNAQSFAREQAARAMAQRSDQRFRDLVDGLEAIVWEADAATFGFTFVSRRAAAILGYPPEQWLAEPDFWVTHILPEDRDRTVALRRSAIREGRSHDLEYRFRAGGARTLWLREQVRVTSDGAGHPIRLSGVTIDITERKYAEVLLAGEKQVVEMMAAGVPLPEVLDALASSVERQSEGMRCSILLLDPDGIHLRHGAAPNLPEPYVRAIDGIAIGPRVGSCGTAVHERRTVVVSDIARDPLWADYRDLAAQNGLGACWSAPIFGGDQRVLGAFAMYYSTPRTPTAEELQAIPRAARVASIAIERARAAEALRQSEERLRQAQMEAVGRLAGGVAHDFNNLLTVMTGRAQLLLSRLSSDDPRRKDVELIERSAERAGTLTRQLLAFSRKQVLQPKVVDLNQVVAGMEAMLHRLIGEHIDLSIVRAAGLGRVKADPGQLEQVLMNLAVNARDAMPDGGRLTIETTNVEVGADAESGRAEARSVSEVVLTVSDTGAGIDEATRSHIFEPFFTTKDQGKGTGLGLATVYGIVEQSGGHIEVESAPGQGATFRIHLPRVAESPWVPAPGSPGATAHGSGTILLAEDEEEVRDLAREILEMYGYTVLVASDGEEAIRVAEGHPGPIDLLLTDVVMPRMGGRQLAEHLRTTRPSLRILFVSGYTDDAILHHGVRGADMAFIEKPFAPAALAQRVRDLLGARPPGNP